MRLVCAVGFFLLISINTSIVSGKNVKKAKATSTTTILPPPFEFLPESTNSSNDADFKKSLALFNSENSGQLLAVKLNNDLNGDTKVNDFVSRDLLSASSSASSSESESAAVDKTELIQEVRHPFVNPWLYPNTNSSVKPSNGRKNESIDDTFFGTWVASNGTLLQQEKLQLLSLTKPYKQPVLQVDKIPQNAKLKYVMTFWRHGERYPLKSYQGDPHAQEYTAGGWGQLTVNGVKQLESVGRRTRHRYTVAIPFLSANLTASEVYIGSNNVDRALTSAEAFIVGFAPSTPILVPGSPTWPKNYIPIAIHGENSEVFFRPWETPCKRFGQLIQQAMQSALFRNIERRVQSMVSEIAEKIGVMPSLSNLDYFMDNIAITLAMGKPVPDWVKPYTATLANIFNTKFRLSFGFFDIDEPAFDFPREFGMLTSGAIGRFIIDSLRERVLAIQGKVESTVKFFGISGHDVTIASVMRALGLPDIPGSTPANFGATLAIELWHSDELVKHGGFFVKIVYYSNSSSDEPLDLSAMIIGCSNDKCSLDIIIQNAYKLTPDSSIKELCATDIDTKLISSGNQNKIAFTLGFVVPFVVPFFV